MTMKRFIPTVIMMFLAACSTQQQQKEDIPGMVTPPTEQPSDPDKTKPQSETTTPVKPFKPVMPGARVSSVSVPGKYVAITFDDGPNSSLTPQVLDILKRHGAHATFFVLGDNASRNPGILSRAVAEGHEIGNHTYSHIKMTASSNEKIASEISRTNSIITSATGRRPKVMRPPYGATNASIVNKMFSDYGMRSIMWSIDTEDWRHPGVGVVVRRAVGSAKPGSIILLHDIHSSTIAAVEDIVTGLQARGYTLVTVSQLIEMGKQAAQAKTAQTGLQQEKVSAAPDPVSGGAGAAVISGSASL